MVSVFAPSAEAAALRAGGVAEAAVIPERRFAGGEKLRVLGQQDGQLLFRHGYRAAAITVDNGDRCSPIALARDQPVAEPVRDRGSLKARLQGEGRDRPLAFLATGNPSELARVDRSFPLPSEPR